MIIDEHGHADSGHLHNAPKAGLNSRKSGSVLSPPAQLQKQPQPNPSTTTDKPMSVVKCPECGSTRLYRDGLRHLADGSSVQRYLCRDCGYRFTSPYHKVAQKQWKNPPYSLNLQNSLDHNCQGNNDPQRREPTSLGKLVQTLATVENTSKSGQAGATATTRFKGQIVEYGFHLQRQGYAEATVRLHLTALKVLADRGADLLNPQSVKEVIAKQK